MTKSKARKFQEMSRNNKMCLKNVSRKARKSEKLSPKRLEKSRKMSLEDLEITIKKWISKCLGQNMPKKYEKNKIKKKCYLTSMRNSECCKCSINPHENVNNVNAKVKTTQAT